MYPTAYGKIWYSTYTKSARGTSYSSYCFLQVHVDNSNQIITRNSFTVTAGTFSVTDVAD